MKEVETTQKTRVSIYQSGQCIFYVDCNGCPIVNDNGKWTTIFIPEKGTLLLSEYNCSFSILDISGTGAGGKMKRIEI